MDSGKQSTQELKHENAQLRAELEEAREALRAIREGEVDSLLISTAEGERVYTLKSADYTYRILVESMQQGAASLIESGEVFYANSFLARMLRIPLQQLIGSSIHNFVHPDDAPRFAALIAQARQSSSEGELRLQAADGALIPVYLAFNNLPLGEKNGLCLAVTDLTPVAAAQRLAQANEQLRQEVAERKKMEHQLARQAEQLRAQSEALIEEDRHKDEFLAMLAHELRNPLAPIRNAVQILHLMGANEQALQRQRGIIDRQIQHMARLLDDLLDISRITQGKIILKKQPLHLTDVLAHAIETSTPLIESRRHKLDVTLPPDDLCVEGDIDRLSQIVSNLLVNAAKYTHEGGRIWLQAAGEDGQAVIRVRDNGMGITPEMLSRVFDLFAQGDKSLARAQGGLGIGLTMVKNLTRMHGGSVEARSAGPGLGSEFIVRLPVLEIRAQEPAETKPHKSGLPKVSSRRILVVDDLVDATSSLAELLTLWGYEVHEANDGLAALAEARAWMPEVVLLDIGMPGMDGHEVARRLREEHGDKMLLIAMTGYAQESDRQRTREAGFTHHMPKPIDLDALRDLLARDGSDCAPVC